MIVMVQLKMLGLTHKLLVGTKINQLKKPKGFFLIQTERIITMQLLINTIILVIIIPTVSLAAALTIARPNKNMPRSAVMLGTVILTTIIAIMFYLFIFFVKR